MEEEEDALIDAVTDDQRLTPEQRKQARSTLRHLYRTIVTNGMDSSSPNRHRCAKMVSRLKPS